MARLRLLILFCLATAELLTVAAGEEGCDEGWTKYGSRCFKFFKEGKTWSDAESACHSLGADLASLHSLEENNFLVELIFKVSGGKPTTWIGGSDAAQEGNWMWDDGSAWDFSLWAPGQPDGGHGIENYLMMNYNGNFWNDSPNSAGAPYACAKRAQQLPEPTPEPKPEPKPKCKPEPKPKPKPVSLTLEGVEYRCVPKTK